MALNLWFWPLRPLRASRDGTVYGCGSTRHGQLPYLKFSSDDEKLQARNEITQATKLKLPMLQVCPVDTNDLVVWQLHPQQCISFSVAGQMCTRPTCVARATRLLYPSLG